MAIDTDRKFKKGTGRFIDTYVSKVKPAPESTRPSKVRADLKKNIHNKNTNS